MGPAQSIYVSIHDISYIILSNTRREKWRCVLRTQIALIPWLSYSVLNTRAHKPRETPRANPRAF